MRPKTNIVPATTTNTTATPTEGQPTTDLNVARCAGQSMPTEALTPQTANDILSQPAEITPVVQAAIDKPNTTPEANKLIKGLEPEAANTTTPDMLQSAITDIHGGKTWGKLTADQKAASKDAGLVQGKIAKASEIHKIPFTGCHQIENAACAVRTSEILLGGTEGIANALSGVKWPGRCELVRHAGMDILLDGAHNPAAAEALSHTLERLYLRERFSEIIIIIGAMADKDSPAMLKALMRRAGTVILSAPSYERAARPQRLLEAAGTLSRAGQTLVTAPTIAEAIKVAANLYKTGSLVVITGSFYTVGEAKEAMGETALLKELAEFR